MPILADFSVFLKEVVDEIDIIIPVKGYGNWELEPGVFVGEILFENGKKSALHFRNFSETTSKDILVKTLMQQALLPQEITRIKDRQWAQNLAAVIWQDAERDKNTFTTSDRTPVYEILKRSVEVFEKTHSWELAFSPLEQVVQELYSEHNISKLKKSRKKRFFRWLMEAISQY